jgi:GT2 family glycosyltransferase
MNRNRDQQKDASPPDYSFIIPVFNRPGEMQELLNSMAGQTRKDFEVVIVEDGSREPCKEVAEAFRDRLHIRYFFKTNSGPGLSRNYGFERAAGRYGIFLDSDCLLPPAYFETVVRELAEKPTDAFGGPDRAHEGFSPLQKAISYSMTSFLTTGGIRGGRKSVETFHPRSFNMGYSREVFRRTGGFSGMRFGEDIDMSIRIMKEGFSTRLIPEAFVYHKRRTNLRQFFKQVYNSGMARIELHRRHPRSLRAVHLAPALLVAGLPLLVLCSVWLSGWFLMPLLLHWLLLLADATRRCQNFSTGVLAVMTSYCQLLGYGSGFLHGAWKRFVRRRETTGAFRDTFYD